MEVTEWEPMLAELVNTALVRVESVEYRLPRYLYLHPTLPYAAQSEDVPDPEDAKRRFLEVYRAVGGEAYGALFGANPSAGMALMRDEEANYRVAIAHAFQGGERQLGWALTDTLREYLERDARQRERDRLVCWVREQLLADNIWDEAACASIRDYAWTLFSQGQVPEAVKALEDLLTRLKKEELSDGSDSMAQEALTLLSVGRIRHSNGQSELALDSLEQAVDVFEQLGEPQRVSLAAALGELANAHHNLGNYEKALSANEHSLAISRELNQAREIAANLGRGAGILMDLQRYSEAEWHYSEALRTAQQANERELQETLLQNRGLLQYRLGNRGRAIELYQDAITRSQQAYNLIGEMQTSTLLGNAERELGNLDAADGWYQRARELAVRLGDDSQLGEVEHNLGILSLTRAEQVSDVVQRTQLLQQAVDLVQEALRIRCELPAQVPIAESYFQLGVLYLMRNDLAQAEMYLLNSKDLRENLGLPVISETYANLAQVAYERGNVVEAARWQILYEAAEAELIWRRGLNKNIPPVVQFDTLLRDIAAVARGEDMNQSVLEKNLSQLEEKKWRIADASRRIWAGERDLTRLAQGVDLLSLTLIARILQFVDHPDTPLLWPDEPDEPGAHPGTPGPPVPPVTDPWTIAEPEPPVKPSGTDPAEGRAATLVPRFVVLLASVTGLTMSILWFMDDRSWEPGIGIVTAISAFLGALIDFKEKRVVSLWKSSFAWLAVVSGFTIAMLFSFAINTHVLLPGNTQPPAPPDTPTLAPSHFRFEVYVKDSATGRPIPNAEVTVGEVGQLAPLSRLTDVNGYTHFEIPSEHAGERATVTLQVDDSYKSRTVDLTRDSAPINISFP
jgi:tetratricopeptide (TPR) repeat protein